MRNVTVIVLLLLVSMVSACMSVDVTKTGKGYYAPTDPNEIDILSTRPDKPYVELATVTTRGHQPSAEAKMHNSLRAKTAPLGANAVIITNSGVDQNGLLWARGVAIRYGKANDSTQAPATQAPPAK